MRLNAQSLWSLLYKYLGSHHTKISLSEQNLNFDTKPTKICNYLIYQKINNNMTETGIYCQIIYLDNHFNYQEAHD